MQASRYGFCALLLVGLLLSTAAGADETAATATQGAPAASIRFRSGISVGGGREMVSGSGFNMGGVDGRLGMQISDLLGIYVQPHLSFGSGGAGSTGTFAGTVLADLTLRERFFAAGGFGYGVLNNPSGAVVHFRAGGYPLMSVSQDGVRRKGLMVGVDSRTFFVSGATVEYVLVSIGYEKY